MKFSLLCIMLNKLNRDLVFTALKCTLKSQYFAFEMDWVVLTSIYFFFKSSRRDFVCLKVLFALIHNQTPFQITYLSFVLCVQYNWYIFQPENKNIMRNIHLILACF